MGISDQFKDKAEKLQKEAKDKLGGAREESKERGEETRDRGRDTEGRGERSMDEERERRRND